MSILSRHQASVAALVTSVSASLTPNVLAESSLPTASRDGPDAALLERAEALMTRTKSGIAEIEAKVEEHGKVLDGLTAQQAQINGDLNRVEIFTTTEAVEQFSRTHYRSIVDSAREVGEEQLDALRDGREPIFDQAKLESMVYRRALTRTAAQVGYDDAYVRMIATSMAELAGSKKDAVLEAAGVAPMAYTQAADIQVSAQPIQAGIGGVLLDKLIKATVVKGSEAICRELQDKLDKDWECKFSAVGKLLGEDAISACDMTPRAIGRLGIDTSCLPDLDTLTHDQAVETLTEYMAGCLERLENEREQAIKEGRDPNDRGTDADRLFKGGYDKLDDRHRDNIEDGVSNVG